MKSNVCTLPREANDTASLSDILNESEKVASYCGLDKKSSGRLRLLAEELVGMLPELLSFSSGEFWIDSEGTTFELHTVLTPDENMTYDLREKLLAVSSNGKNEAAKGIMSKIRLAAAFMLIDYEENAFINEGFYAAGLDPSQAVYSAVWNLDTYRQKAKEKQGEEWDELERSIIANIADDVLVGVQGKRVDIIVKKTF